MRPNAALLDHLRNPRQLGAFEPGEAGVSTGEARGVRCPDLVRVHVRVDGSGALDVRFQAFGCSACIASASAFLEAVTHGNPATIEEIAATFELEEERLECAGLVEQAWRRATHTPR
jgi:nitrogen fixation NifU-like protein